MPRRKKEPPFWTTGLLIPQAREQFGAPRRSLYRHPAFKALSYGARCLYLSMLEACAGHREFTFSKSDCEAYGINRMTFLRERQQLIDGGFIEYADIPHKPGTAWVYRFIDRWKYKGT